MKIFAETKEHSFKYEWNSENSKDQLLHNGKPLHIELVALGAGRYSLIKDNTPYIINISKQNEMYQVRVVGNQYEVSVEDERTRKVKELVKAAAGAKGERVINAPIPGLVVKVLVNLNDRVQKGAGLLILEAMKMENIIKAPFDCDVMEILVSEKDTVNQNQSLIKIRAQA